MRSDDRRLTRRAALGLAAAPLTGLAACRGEPVSQDTVLPLASLPPGEHVRLLHGEEPIELVRGPEGVRARSLWCTHTGCEVRWESARNVYQCVCHEGRFDADGNPILGPPTRPLREVPVRIEGDRLIIPFVKR